MSEQPHQISSALELGPDLPRVLASLGYALDAVTDNKAPTRTETAFALMEAVGTAPRETRLYLVGTQAAARLLIDDRSVQHIGDGQWPA